MGRSAEIVHSEDGRAEDHEDRAGDAVQSLGLRLVGEERRDLRKEQRAGHADDQRRPPMTKWLAAPVSAVALMMNTLVPTAVFSS